MVHILLLFLITCVLHQPPTLPAQPSESSWHEDEDTTAPKTIKEAIKKIEDHLQDVATERYWPQLRWNERAISRGELDPYIETSPTYFLGISVTTPSPYAPVHAIDKELKKTKALIETLTPQFNFKPEDTTRWLKRHTEMRDTLKNSGLHIYVARILAMQLNILAAEKSESSSASSPLKMLEPRQNALAHETKAHTLHTTTAGKIKTLKTMLSHLPNNGAGIYEIDRCIKNYPELQTELSLPQPRPPFMYGPPYLFPPMMSPFMQFNSGGIMPMMHMGT